MWGGRPRLSGWACGPRIVMKTDARPGGRALARARIYPRWRPFRPPLVFDILRQAFDRAAGLSRPAMPPTSVKPVDRAAAPNDSDGPRPDASRLGHTGRNGLRRPPPSVAIGLSRRISVLTSHPVRMARYSPRGHFRHAKLQARKLSGTGLKPARGLSLALRHSPRGAGE